MDRPATTSEEQFLDHIGRRVGEGERPNIRQAEWLLARAERLEAIERALRGDPGHDVTAAVVSPTEDRTKSVSLWERMGRALLASTGPFDPAVCRVCGRSDDFQWVEGTDRTLCNRTDCLEAALASGMVDRAEEPEVEEEPPEGPFSAGPCDDGAAVFDADGSPIFLVPADICVNGQKGAERRASNLAAVLNFEQGFPLR